MATAPISVIFNFVTLLNLKTMGGGVFPAGSAPGQRWKQLRDKNPPIGNSLVGSQYIAQADGHTDIQLLIHGSFLCYYPISDGLQFGDQMARGQDLVTL